MRSCIYCIQYIHYSISPIQFKLLYIQLFLVKLSIKMRIIIFVQFLDFWLTPGHCCGSRNRRYSTVLYHFPLFLTIWKNFTSYEALQYSDISHRQRNPPQKKILTVWKALSVHKNCTKSGKSLRIPAQGCCLRIGVNWKFDLKVICKV